MNYLIEARLDALAAAFVLGSLSPRAARRFQSVMHTSQEARAAVDAWQERLHKLSVATPWVEPSDKVWRRITESIGGRARSSSGWHYRWLPALSAACGLLTGLGLAWLEPSWINGIPTSKMVPVPVPVPVPSDVGILTNSGDQPVLVFSALQLGQEPAAKILRPLHMPKGQAQGVWALSDRAVPMASGVLLTSGKSVIALPQASETTFLHVSSLAVTCEAAADVLSAATPMGRILCCRAIASSCGDVEHAGLLACHARGQPALGRSDAADDLSTMR